MLRTEVDAIIAGALDLKSSGPVSRPDAKKVADAILDYIDDEDSFATVVGTVNAVTGLALTRGTKRGSVVNLLFTLTNVAVPWTDAAGSGSSGSIKLFDFVQGAIQVLAARRSLVSVGDSAIDTGAGDLAYVHALGSVAANAGDGALTSTEVDFAAVSGTVTHAAGTATTQVYNGAGAAVVDGTATAADLILNFSGTAATSDANGTLTVTGTIELTLVMLGDD